MTNMRKLLPLLAFTLGISLAVAYNQSRPAAPQKPDSDQSGRFAILMSATVRADQYLLDTFTGRVWLKTQITDLVGEPVVWLYVDRLDSEKEFVEWSGKRTFKKKQ